MAFVTLPSGVRIPVIEHFVRSSGPGGQNVNKVATAVELRFDLAGSALPDDLKSRARALAGHRLTSDGVIVFHAHEHRTQAANRQAARERLVALLSQAGKRPKRRKKTATPAVAREHRLSAKKQRSQLKRRRSTRADDD